MNNSLTEPSNVRKNDKLAVVGFSLGVISIIYIFLIRLFFYFYFKSPSNDPMVQVEYPRIAEEIIWFVIILSLGINLAAIILSVFSIIRIKLNKEKKGLWLAVTGATLGLVPLTFVFWILIFN